MLTTTAHLHPNPLRDTITNAYRMDETDCINFLMKAASLPESERHHIANIAKQLVEKTRAYQKQQGQITALLHQYDLSTEEGIALMCLAEALLRIPDKATKDRLISDKLSTAAWKNHLSPDHSFFINAATWSLLLTGKMYAPTLEREHTLGNSLKRMSSRLGIVIIRPIIMQMMKIIGNQFVMGEDIATALQRANRPEHALYRFSYDMLGEAARTAEDAKQYYAAYVVAIDAIGQTISQKDSLDKNSLEKNPGISIKLSALHPRYDYTQHQLLLEKLPPLLLALAKQAQKYNIGLTVDAEEADRLDLSLDIFEKVFMDDSLHWEGLGLALQAYQKRAFFCDRLAS